MKKVEKTDDGHYVLMGEGAPQVVNVSMLQEWHRNLEAVGYPVVATGKLPSGRPASGTVVQILQDWVVVNGTVQIAGLDSRRSEWIPKALFVEWYNVG